MTIAIILVWLGSLIAFLGSKQQKLLATTLSKKLTLPIFSICLVSSWLLLCEVYTGVIAGLFILTVVMVMWILIVFVQGHSSIRLLPFTALGAVTSVALIQLGGL